MMTLQRMARLARRLRQELIWGDTKFPLREEEFFWHLRYANSGMLHQGNLGLGIDAIPGGDP
jgi:hypothetical protein